MNTSVRFRASMAINHRKYNMLTPRDLGHIMRLCSIQRPNNNTIQPETHSYKILVIESLRAL